MAAKLQFLTGVKELSIDLREPVVILRGHRNDKTNQLIEGKVNLVLTRPMTVSRISIKFVGKTHSLWPEGVGARKNKFYHEKTIHQQEIDLLNYNKEHTLERGTYVLPFQFLLSNELVETIEDEMAKVFYYLSTTVYRVGRGGVNPKQKREILLLRIPNWSNDALVSHALNSGSIISERRLRSCEVNICVETSHTSSGTPFPVSFSIVPHQKNLFLESTSVILTEKKIYRLPEFQAKRVESYDYKMALTSVAEFMTSSNLSTPPSSSLEMKDFRRLLHVRNAHIPLDTVPFHHRLTFLVPNCLHVNHTSTFSEIDIRHYLKIKVTISNGLKKDEEPIVVYLEAPITILDCRLKEDFNTLPSYDQFIAQDEQTTGFFVCPCYLAYRKSRQGSLEDWMRGKHLTDQPPPYDSIQYFRNEN